MKRLLLLASCAAMWAIATLGYCVFDRVWLYNLTPTPGPGLNRDVKVDQLGTSTVVGTQSGPPNSFRGIVTRFNKCGQAQFRTYVATLTGSNIELNAVDVDGNGNTYAAGREFFGPTDGAILVKLNPTGGIEWRRSVPGSTGLDVVTDGNGNIVWTGRHTTNGTTFLQKYTPLGVLVWSNVDPVPSTSNTHRLAVDNLNDVYLGYTVHPAAFDVVRIGKVNALGVPLWLHNYAAPDESHRLVGMDINSTGDLFFSETINQLAPNPQIFVRTQRLHPGTGITIWGDDEAMGNFPSSFYDGMDAEGGRADYWAVTGRARDADGEMIRTVCYDRIGTRLWVNQFRGGNSAHQGAAVDVDLGANAYVGGFVGGDPVFLGIRGATGNQFFHDDNPQGMREVSYTGPWIIGTGSRTSGELATSRYGEFQPFPVNVFNITRGVYAGGNLNSLHEVDDDLLYILNDVFHAVGTLEVAGFGPLGSDPCAIRLRVVSSITRPDVLMVASFWNFQTMTWTNAGAAPAPEMKLGTIFGRLTFGVSEFLTPATNMARAKVDWIPQADYDASDGWFEEIDFVGFELAY